jgi:uncharacterized protein
MINFWNLRISDGATVSPLTDINLEVTEVTLPTISRQFNDDKRVGYISNVPYPLGYELSALEFTTKGLTPTTMRLLARIGKTTFVFTGCESSDGTTFSVTTVTCRGYIEDNPLGSFADDGAEYQATVRVDYLEVVDDGTAVLRFDPLNYVYEVNGVNQLASIRTSLGLGS